MRITILVLLMIVILAGCNSETNFSHHAEKQYQVKSTFSASYYSGEQIQTPIISNSKLFGKNLVTAINPDSAPIPTFIPILSSGDTSSFSKVNTSDKALEIIGQQARGNLILHEVSLISQTDYTSCGEAAFVMAWNYKHPAWVLDIDMVEATGLNLNVYFPARFTTPHGYLGTSPSGMEVIGNFYANEHNLPPPTVGNIDLDKGAAYARLEAKGLFYYQLSKGNPVIIEVTDSIGTPNNIYNDSHYVIVTGMNFDTSIVIYNDPLVNLSMSGKYSGVNRLTEWSQIWISWSSNNDINPGEAGHPGRGWFMIVH